MNPRSQHEQSSPTSRTPQSAEPRGGGRAQGGAGAGEHAGRHEDMSHFEECARLCHECHDECLHLVPHCLDLGGPHAAKAHITALLDCAQFCHLADDLMHRHSPHAAHLCRECAEVCRACAASCDKLATGADAQRHRACADLCRRCADACAEMAGA